MLHSQSKVPSKAVLIGINYQAWPVYNLNGCHADVADAEKFLLKIGMKQRDIRIITDKKNSLAPTKAAILEAFDWIKEGADDGDVLYIHYSGHGVETDPPSDNPLARASSKAICPIDLFHSDVSEVTGKWDYDSLSFVNPITGEDFSNIFGHFENSKVNLTVVYDCCHSTGAMRAVGAPGEPTETSVRGIHVPADMKLHKTVTKKVKELNETDTSRALSERGGLNTSYEKRYSPAELAPPYVIGFAAAQGWEFAIDARTSSGPCGAFSHFFYALLNTDAKNVNGQGIIDSVTESLKKNSYSQTPSLTTTKKTVPFLADLSQSTRALGANYEKMSAPRSIHAEELEDEIDMLARDEKVLKKSHSGKSNGSKHNGKSKDDSSDEEDHHHQHGNGKSNGKSNVKSADDSDDEKFANKGRDIGGKSGDADADSVARSHVQHMVNVCSQIAASPELQKLRQQERGLFDSLLQHALPFALHAASSAVGLLTDSGKRDIGTQLTIQQHLPTAINFAQQVMSLPEVQEKRGLFDKIFTTCMPIVLDTAQQLLGAKRGLENATAADDEAQRGFFDLIVSNLPSTVMNVLSDVMSSGHRDLGTQVDRGFLDILKKVAPVVLSVATSAVNSLSGQRSLSFSPQQTDRGFFDSLKNMVTKVVSNPVVKKIGTAALNVGVEVATAALASKTQGQRGIEAPSGDYAEAHTRGFFGTMLQYITPIAIGAVQGAAQAVSNSLNRSIGTTAPHRGIFDILSQALPAVVQVAQQHFNQNRSLTATPEEEAVYLQRVLNNVTGPLIQAARTQAANPNNQRGLGDIIGSVLSFII